MVKQHLLIKLSQVFLEYTEDYHTMQFRINFLKKYKGQTIIGATMRNILTTKELADYLKLTETTIYRYVREGKVPAYWKDGRWRFRKDQIDALLKGMELQKAHLI